jgi:PKD repeat protein
VALLCFGPAAQANTGDPLAYFGGPVAHSMSGVLVDWGPNVNPIYTDETTGDPGLIKYFATSSGETAVLGGVLAQYMDSTGHNAANSVSYGHQYVITPSVTGTPTVPGTPGPPGTTFQDSDVKGELVSQINAGHLPRPPGNGLSSIYLVLFPAGDTICASQGECSGQQLCAYHGSTQLTDGTHVLYAVLPDNTSGGMASGCGAAHTALQNQTSYTTHEWSETITDPLVAEATAYAPPLAWYDKVCPRSSSSCGNGEIGDKCNQLSGVQGGWTVQLEWSNLDANCAGTEPHYSQPTASFVAPASPAPGQLLSFDGSGSTDPSQNHTSATDASATDGANSYSIPSGLTSYDWNWGDSTAHGSGATASHTYAQPGTYQVSLTVTDNLGFTSTVTKQVSVSGPSQATPDVTTAPATGVTADEATLNGSINPNDQTISYRFVYGTSSANLDQSTPLTAGPSGHTATPVSATISGLVPSTTYYYRLDVTMGGQTYSGATASFTSGAAPPAPPAPQTPLAGTGSATQVGIGAAHLDGTVNPGGPAAVTYRFSYGSSAANLDHSSSDTPVPAGTTASPVGATITGLSPSTTYYFRLDVTLAGATYSGAVRSFTTLAPAPSVSTGTVNALTSNKATVGGRVGPNGIRTIYHFEYGRSAAYGHSSPSVTAGAGAAPVLVSATLGSLQPSTTYHYRLVASSAGGTVVGADLRFKTSVRPPSPPKFSFSLAHGPAQHSVRTHRLVVRFSCSKACTAQFVITVVLNGITRFTATPLALAQGSGRLRAAGSGRVTLSFTTSTQKWLRAKSRAKLVVSGYANGSGGVPSAPRWTTLTLA